MDPGDNRPPRGRARVATHSLGGEALDQPVVGQPQHPYPLHLHERYVEGERW